MRHEHRLTVRTYECDSNGHVNNATYLNYLEVARVDFLRSAGVSYRDLKAEGFALVVVRISIEYKGEALMEDPLLVVTEPTRRRLTGGTFRQSVFREEGETRRLLADAEVAWACVDSRGKPVRLPPLLDKPELEPAESPRD